MATTQEYDDALSDVKDNGKDAKTKSLRLVRAEASQAGGRGNNARAALDKHKLPHTV